MNEEINETIREIDKVQKELDVSTIDIVICVDCDVQVNVNRIEGHEGHIFTIEGK